MTQNTGWFFPTEEEGSGANSHPPQNTEQVVGVIHDLDIDHPNEIVTNRQRIPHDLESK